MTLASELQKSQQIWQHKEESITSIVLAKDKQIADLIEKLRLLEEDIPKQEGETARAKKVVNCKNAREGCGSNEISLIVPKSKRRINTYSKRGPGSIQKSRKKADIFDDVFKFK